MITVALVAFIAGVLSHKGWRILVDRTHHHTPWVEAVKNEFFLPNPVEQQRRNRRPPSITEIA